MRGCGTIYARFFEVMGSPVPSNQPLVSVAGDTFAPRLPRKVLGAGLGAVVAGLVLAPSPAQAFVSGNPCSTYSTSLIFGDSCTITDGADTYEISLLGPSEFSSAFRTPGTGNMFWWGSSSKAFAAATQVGDAWGGLGYPIYPGAVGPLFAYEPGTDPYDGATVVALMRIAGYEGEPGGGLVESGAIVYGGDVVNWASSRLVTNNTNNVPGPLPILGLAAAFGFSRKLRKRIKLHRGTSAVSTSPGA